MPRTCPSCQGMLTRQTSYLVGLLVFASVDSKSETNEMPTHKVSIPKPLTAPRRKLLERTSRRGSEPNTHQLRSHNTDHGRTSRTRPASRPSSTTIICRSLRPALVLGVTCRSRSRGLLELADPLGDVTVVDIPRIDVHETLERRLPVSGHFIGRAHLEENRQ